MTSPKKKKSKSKSIKQIAIQSYQRIMIDLSPERIWQMDEKELSSLLDKRLPFLRSRKIRFYAPSFMYYKTSHYCSSPDYFPTISVTGAGCALKCKHCGGKLLNTMHPAATPRALVELCARLKQKGAKGVLISGGCLPNGTVPLSGFIDAMAKIKRELSLTIFVHTGIVDDRTAVALNRAGIDAALIDIIGCETTIKEIYNLDVSVKDYADSLRALHEAGIEFVPHVIVGLHYGKLQGEFNALRMISEHKPSAVVVIAFMPIRGTEMGNVEPPKPLDIARVMTTARVMFPRIPLVLGCMRSNNRGRAETEILAIRAGADAIAFPTEKTVEFAGEHGYSPSFSSFCCSQIYVDVKNDLLARNNRGH